MLQQAGAGAVSPLSATLSTFSIIGYATRELSSPTSSEGVLYNITMTRLILPSSAVSSTMTPRQVIAINKNWQFKQADSDDAAFLPVAQFPTNVHLDLMHHGLIPDPYIGKNELDVQWIGEKRWIYKTTFNVPGAVATRQAAASKAVLVFDGLDTFATVVLNGTVILESDNMFTPERVDVTSTLRDVDNDLVITFDSAYLRGWRDVEKYPGHKWGCWNGDNSRLAVRKVRRVSVASFLPKLLIAEQSSRHRLSMSSAGTGALS